MCISFKTIWNNCTLLHENVSKNQLDEVERFADRLFAKIGIDVDLHGKHFFDRLNDARNGKAITTPELISLFKKTFKMHAKPIAGMDAGVQAVIKDLDTNINIPFLIKWDDRNSEFDLVAKTIMRKKDFDTSNPVLKV